LVLQRFLWNPPMVDYNDRKIKYRNVLHPKDRGAIIFNGIILSLFVLYEDISQKNFKNQNIDFPQFVIHSKHLAKLIKKNGAIAAP